jgi:hypothetical protein
VREHLRGEGMIRKKANRVAREKMLEAYPPADVSTVEPGEPSLDGGRSNLF